MTTTTKRQPGESFGDWWTRRMEGRPVREPEPETCSFCEYPPDTTIPDSTRFKTDYEGGWDEITVDIPICNICNITKEGQK